MLAKRPLLRRRPVCASAPEVPPSEVSFRPRGFTPPRRFPPLCESRACCIPLPILGSIAFPRRASGRRPASHDAFPRCRIRTLRRNPRRKPYRVTAALAFLPFPRDHRPRSRRTVAGASSVEVGGSKAPAPRPCSVVGSGIGPHRFRCGRPTPSWASFLFKVLPDSRRSRLPPPYTTTRAPEGDARWQAPFRTRCAARPKPNHTPSTAPAANRVSRGIAPDGPMPGPRRHTIRRPRPPQRTRAGRPKPTDARHGTGATRTEVRASGPDPGRNPSERSPCVRVHCTTDPLANQGAGKPTLQANLQCRPPMSSKSIRS